jgi:hypothetical protein
VLSVFGERTRAESAIDGSIYYPTIFCWAIAEHVSIGIRELVCRHFYVVAKNKAKGAKGGKPERKQAKRVLKSMKDGVDLVMGRCDNLQK